MKFIRDIINEKKQATDPESQTREAIATPRARDEAVLVLDNSHAVTDNDPQGDAAGFSLLDDPEPSELVEEPVESLFAEAADVPEAEDTPMEDIDREDADETGRDPASDTPAQAGWTGIPARHADERPAGFDEAEAEEYSAAILHPEPVSRAPEHEADLSDRLGEPIRPGAGDELRQHLLARSGRDEAPQPFEVPGPSAGRASRRAGRVKTRLLGFGPAQGIAADPFAAGSAAPLPEAGRFPVGWLVVVDGPGRGAVFTLFDGVAQIGRGEDQAVRLDFGDTSISRSYHAAIAYDCEQKAFFLGHGGKANLVRLNGRPVLSTEQMNSGDQIRIGETRLRFIGLCGPDFDWSAGDDESGLRVSHA